MAMRSSSLLLVAACLSSACAFSPLGRALNTRPVPLQTLRSPPPPRTAPVQLADGGRKSSLPGFLFFLDVRGFIWPFRAPRFLVFFLLAPDAYRICLHRAR